MTDSDYPMRADSDSRGVSGGVDRLDSTATVLGYHERTKHHFERYAAGPGALDWDAQPAPFRHFVGCTTVPLPLVDELRSDAALGVLLDRARNTPAAKPAPLTLDAIGALLNLALGITAWKQYGPERWALRANPSSGNLHPIEGYLLLCGIAGVVDGLYHYDPLQHALELRASFPDETRAPTLLIGLTSVNWREAWKYGERAFRYCQLDAGHAHGAVRLAAQVLGWSINERRDISTIELGQLLGADRRLDFPGEDRTEYEEPELLLELRPSNVVMPAALLPLQQAAAQAQWHGRASTIDRHPKFDWPVIDEVANASRHQAQDSSIPSAIATTSPAQSPSKTSGIDLILSRRSAQRFDGQQVMSFDNFQLLITALMPEKNNYWRGVPSNIALLLFIHRVDQIPAGLYLLPRTPELSSTLRAALPRELPLTPMPQLPPLQLIATVEPQPLKREARALHCHQDIAASSCLALGMLAPLQPMVQSDAGAYRDLLREAGLIGQMLYLQAEAIGLRGTGIGCYFDDPVHELIGLDREQFQSLYHFTIGRPLEDSRIQTDPAYPRLAC